MTYRMPALHKIVHRLERAWGRPYNTDTSIAIGNAVSQGLLTIWRPRWNEIVENFKLHAKALKQTGDVSSALAIVRLHAMRERVYPGMQEAQRGIEYFDDHHDWLAEAVKVLDARVGPDGVKFPSLQDADPFADEYLPSRKAKLNVEGIVVLQKGVVRPLKAVGDMEGEAILGLAERLQEGRKKPRIMLSIMLSMSEWRPFRVDLQSGGAYGFSGQSAQNLREWVNNGGFRVSRGPSLAPSWVKVEHQERHRDHTNTLKRVGVLLVAGEWST